MMTFFVGTIDMSPTPSTLDFAASLGALRAVVKRAKARHSFFLVTARRAVKCISWLAGVDAGKQTELRKKRAAEDLFYRWSRSMR